MGDLESGRESAYSSIRICVAGVAEIPAFADAAFLVPDLEIVATSDDMNERLI